jgi:hypothetical protein
LKRDVIAGSFGWLTVTSGTLDLGYDNSEVDGPKVDRSSSKPRPLDPFRGPAKGQEEPGGAGKEQGEAG